MFPRPLKVDPSYAQSHTSYCSWLHSLLLACSQDRVAGLYGAAALHSISLMLPPVSTIAPPAVQAASTLFTFGTAFVIPFYTVMILAPHAKWTKKLVESNLPYVVLGILYLYLLSLSWTTETLQLLFASKYWLPELPGITRMFSSTLTVASAWIHLLTVDLFAGRQIYHDGLQYAIETRHSLVLCLLSCPVGILSHYMTKVVVRLWGRANNEEVPDVSKLHS